MASGENLLSLEQTPKELTWSNGSNIDSALVAKAFNLETKADLLKRTNVAPTATLTGKGCFIIIVIWLAIFVLLLLMSRCSSSMRSSGGSFGSF